MIFFSIYSFYYLLFIIYDFFLLFFYGFHIFLYIDLREKIFFFQLKTVIVMTWL